MKRHRFYTKNDDDLDPLNSLTNLFDVAMVFRRCPDGGAGATPEWRSCC